MKCLLNNIPRSGPFESLPENKKNLQKKSRCFLLIPLKKLKQRKFVSQIRHLFLQQLKEPQKILFIINFDNVSGSENKNVGGPADLETVESEATATLTADEMEKTNDRYIYFADWLLFPKFPISTLYFQDLLHA